MSDLDPGPPLASAPAPPTEPMAAAGPQLAGPVVVPLGLVRRLGNADLRRQRIACHAAAQDIAGILEHGGLPAGHQSLAAVMPAVPMRQQSWRERRRAGHVAADLAAGSRDWLFRIHPANAAELPNCAECVVAADSALAGGDRRVQPCSYVVGYQALERLYPDRTFANATFDEVRATLLARGPGGRGIVHVKWPDGSGHFFNAAHNAGRVIAIDAQRRQEYPDLEGRLKAEAMTEADVTEVTFLETTGYLLR